MLRIVRLGLLLAVLLAAWVALLQRTAGDEAIHTAVLLAPLAALVLFGAVLVCQLLYGVATFRTVPEEAELLQKVGGRRLAVRTAAPAAGWAPSSPCSAFLK
jgi:protein-S-isoprenylcysteine O-methyltransferase Ste14